MRPSLLAALLATATLLSTACSSQDEESPTEAVPAATAPARQLNLTVLLDLSNRITATYGNETQRTRDAAIVQATAEAFKQNIAQLGGFLAKGSYQVYFEPQPTLTPNLNKVANSLQFDLSSPGTKPADKKQVYNTVVGQTVAGVQTLYDYVGKQPFLGADIWGFAKDKMASRCIKDPAKYRNVLVLVTDGYIDHIRNHNIAAGNKVANLNFKYIEQNLVKQAGFTQANWLNKYQAGGYGLLPPPDTNLKGLEVLVLEVNSYGGPPFYTDLIKQYNKDWFNSMGATRVEVKETDLPVNTGKEIQGFLK